MTRTVSALLLVVTIAACGGTEKTIVVSGRKANCVGLTEQLCLLVGEGDAEPQFAFAEPEGFTFEWCRESTLRVREEPVVPAPADGSSIRQVLIEVIDSRIVDEQFELRVFEDQVDDQGTVVDVPFACADAATCASLTTDLSDDDDTTIQSATLQLRCSDGTLTLDSFAIDA